MDGYTFLLGISTVYSFQNAQSNELMDSYPQMQLGLEGKGLLHSRLFTGMITGTLPVLVTTPLNHAYRLHFLISENLFDFRVVRVVYTVPLPTSATVPPPPPSFHASFSLPSPHHRRCQLPLARAPATLAQRSDRDRTGGLV